MKIVVLLLLLVVVAMNVAAEVTGKGTAKGEFDYEKQKCSWYEMRETGSKRALFIQCKGNKPFKTKYLGDPHKCSMYKDNKQVAYYECLIRALKKANFCANSPSTVACDKKNCGNIKFERVSPGSRLLTLFKKTMTVEEEMLETEEPEWNEFDPITGFN